MFIEKCPSFSPHSLHTQRYGETNNTTEREEGEGEAGGGGGKGEEEMCVISRNNLVTPVEMVGADKINKKTRLVLKHIY